ncbi:hypothetical protein ACM5Q9_07025 [Advenella sp. RU8]
MMADVLNGIFKWLATQLVEQFVKSAKLEVEISKNLAELGYGC